MSSSQAADLNNRGGKVFVLVHGAGQGAWAFGKVAWPLARDGHQVIARDLPGHGLRARYPQSYLERPSDPDRFADLLIEFVEHTVPAEVDEDRWRELLRSGAASA